ncbi:hypothetical protein QR680_007287 [Steinernema hermaphroditum]|uniref:Uncharacterized protein n=1 Tax=Steinernema hermaphroditum TaxID=289476 RepID=A0AA39LY04_9BILA|nr:hypothetical protein QR680_007287 [Steinernema hermaphroditum]
MRVLLLILAVFVIAQASKFWHDAGEKISNISHVAMNKTKAAGEKVAAFAKNASHDAATWGKNAAHTVEAGAEKLGEKVGIVKPDNEKPK